MTIPTPKIPFIWPAPHLLEDPSVYEPSLLFGDLIRSASWLFGLSPALTSRGVQVLEEWLDGNVHLQILIIVVVYPTCAAHQPDLESLRALVDSHRDRLSVRILPLEQVTDNSMNALCFSVGVSDSATFTVGSSENLGLAPRGRGQINFAFQGNLSLVDAFRAHFDWLWSTACDIDVPGATSIPELVLPRGSFEANATWASYLVELARLPPEGDADNAFAEDVNVSDLEEPLLVEDRRSQSPTARLGIKAIDPLGRFMFDLYGKGSFVSIDKLSMIPPLDAPLNPNLFGDASEVRSGSVTRKVNMRVSVIDEKQLKMIEACRQALRPLLTKFTYGLGDNMRWMPNAAISLFEAELALVNQRGQALIGSLLSGDVDAFLSNKRDKLILDLNGIYVQLGRLGMVPPKVVDEVLESLKVRLTKARSLAFMPKLTYSSISFLSTTSEFASPWGQAYSLLADIAALPRKAYIDSFFFHGVTTPRSEFIAAMNVADDAILRSTKSFDFHDHTKRDLIFLKKIEDADVEPKLRCELVRRLIEGEPISDIERNLTEEGT